jgi:hypothetical protein
VTHAGEQFRQQHGDQGVIFDDEHAEHFHQPLDAHLEGRCASAISHADRQDSISDCLANNVNAGVDINNYQILDA